MYLVDECLFKYRKMEKMILSLFRNTARKRKENFIYRYSDYQNVIFFSHAINMSTAPARSMLPSRYKIILLKVRLSSHAFVVMVCSNRQNWLQKEHQKEKEIPL